MPTFRINKYTTETTNGHYTADIEANTPEEALTYAEVNEQYIDWEEIRQEVESINVDSFDLEAEV